MQEELESNMKYREEQEQKFTERERIMAQLQTERDDYQLLFENETKKHSAETEELRQKCRDLEAEVDALEQKQVNEVCYFRRLVIVHRLVWNAAVRNACIKNCYNDRSS